MIGRVVIIEPNAEGHHYAYVQLVARAALAEGLEVQLRLPQDAPAFREFIFPLLGTNGVTARDISVRKRAVMHATFSALCDPLVDRVILLDADRWLPGVLLAQAGARLPDKLRVLVTRPAAQEPTVAAKARFLVKAWCGRGVGRLAGPRSVAILAVPDARWRDSWPTSVVEVDDPNLIPVASVNKTAARRLFGLPPEGLVLGMIGVLASRKNPELASKAANLLDATVLRVGPDQDGSARLLTGAVHIDRFASNMELSAAIRSCDALLCLYDNEGSSGIVTAALAHRVPVVAAGAEGIRTMVSSLGAGVTCALTPDAVARAVLEVLQNELPPPRRRSTEFESLTRWAVN